MAYLCFEFEVLLVWIERGDTFVLAHLDLFFVEGTEAAHHHHVALCCFGNHLKILKLYHSKI